MDLVTCKVRLGGDLGSVVFCGPERGVTYPELAVLAAIHGGPSLLDITVIGQMESNPAEEKGRLAAIYDPEVVERVYPGLHPQMMMAMPAAAKRAAKVKEDI